jgi:hypothetical protein
MIFELSGFDAQVVLVTWFLILLMVLGNFEDPKKKKVWKTCSMHPHQDTCVHRQEKK